MLKCTIKWDMWRPVQLIHTYCSPLFNYTQHVSAGKHGKYENILYIVIIYCYRLHT